MSIEVNVYATCECTVDSCRHLFMNSEGGTLEKYLLSSCSDEWLRQVDAHMLGDTFLGQADLSRGTSQVVGGGHFAVLHCMLSY